MELSFLDAHPFVLLLSPSERNFNYLTDTISVINLVKEKEQTSIGEGNCALYSAISCNQL